MSHEESHKEAEQCSGRIEEAASREELLLELAHCLKSARKSRKLNTEEIGLTLKLRPVYIEALESGDWSEMPGEVYALGFLKQYASFLGLDVSDSIEKLKTGQYKLTKPLTFPDPSIAPNKTWVIVAALVFVVVLILFNLIDNEQPDQSSLPAEKVTEGTIPAVNEAPLLSGSGENTKQLPAAASSASTEDSVSISEPSVAHEYKLFAIGADVWLQLYTEEGSVEGALPLREALLHSGESITIHHPSPFLMLTCGNPVALEVAIDGKRVITAGSLGQSGKVLRNFKLHANNE